MSTTSPTLWDLEPHSKGKHDILLKYAQAWIPIMASRHRRLLIVDGFAGPGRYLGGERGSPLILLDAYLSHSYRQHITGQLVYLFIEEREDRVQHLRNEIGQLSCPSNVDIRIIHGRYEDVFGRQLGAIQAEGNQTAPTLAFIDPFGYGDSPMELTGDFLRFPQCEVLVYMPLPWVARFVGRAGQDRAMTSLFGTDEYRGAIPLDGDARRNYLHDLFRDQLQQHGSRYVRSFEIRTGRGNGYHLFFGTSHPLGMEKMKDAMWSVDPREGQSYTDSTRTDQMVLFQDSPDPGPLRADFRRHFEQRVFTIEEAERFAVLETAYKKGHVRKLVLREAERVGQLEVLSPRQKAGSYPAGTTMRFLRSPAE